MTSKSPNLSVPTNSPQGLDGASGDAPSASSYLTPRLPRRISSALNLSSTTPNSTPTSAISENLFTNSPLNRQLTDAREKACDLRRRMISAENENADLISQISNVEEDRNEKERQIRKQQSEIANLRRELEELRQQISKAADSPTKQLLHNRLYTLKRDEQNKDEELSTLKKELETVNTKALVRLTSSKCETKDRALNKITLQLEDVFTDHEAEIRGFRLELDRMIKEEKDRKDELDEGKEAQHRLEKAEHKLEEIQEKLVISEENCVQITNEKHHLESQIEQTQNQVESLQIENTNLNLNIAHVKKEWEICKASKEEYCNLATERGHKIVELENCLLIKQTEFESNLCEKEGIWKMEEEMLKEKIDTLQKQIQLDSQKFKDMKFELSTELKTREKECMQLNAQISQLEEEKSKTNDSLLNNFDELKEFASEAQKNLDHLSVENQQINFELNEAKKQIKEINILMENKQQNIQQLDEELSELSLRENRMSEENERQTQNLREEINKQKVEVKLVKEMVTEMTNQRDSIKSDHEDTVYALSSLKETHSGVLSELENCQQKILSLQGKLDNRVKSVSQLQINMEDTNDVHRKEIHRLTNQLEFESCELAEIKAVEIVKDNKIHNLNELLENIKIEHRESLANQIHKMGKLRVELGQTQTLNVNLEKKVFEQEEILHDWTLKWEQNAIDLGDFEEQTKKLEEVIETLKLESKQMQERIDFMKDDNQQFIENQQILEKDLSACRIVIEEAEKAREIVETRLQNARTQFCHRINQMSKCNEVELEESRKYLDGILLEKEQILAEHKIHVQTLHKEYVQKIEICNNKVHKLSQQSVELQETIKDLEAERENLMQLPLRANSSLSLAVPCDQDSTITRRLSLNSIDSNMSINAAHIAKIAAPMGDDEDSIMESVAIPGGFYTLHVPQTQQDKVGRMNVNVEYRTSNTSTPEFKKPFTPIRTSISGHDITSGGDWGQLVAGKSSSDENWSSRLSEINENNKKALPHLRSSNPVETMNLNLNSKDEEALKHADFRFDDKMVHNFGKKAPFGVLDNSGTARCSPGFRSIKKFVKRGLSPMRGRRSVSTGKDKENASPSTSKTNATQVPKIVKKSETFQVSPPLRSNTKKSTKSKI